MRPFSHSHRTSRPDVETVVRPNEGEHTEVSVLSREVKLQFYGSTTTGRRQSIENWVIARLEPLSDEETIVFENRSTVNIDRTQPRGSVEHIARGKTLENSRSSTRVVPHLDGGRRPHSSAVTELIFRNHRPRVFATTESKAIVGSTVHISSRVLTDLALGSHRHHDLLSVFRVLHDVHIDVRLP